MFPTFLSSLINGFPLDYYKNIMKYNDIDIYRTMLNSIYIIKHTTCIVGWGTSYADVSIFEFEDEDEENIKDEDEEDYNVRLIESNSLETEYPEEVNPLSLLPKWIKLSYFQKIIINHKDNKQYIDKYGNCFRYESIPVINHTLKACFVNNKLKCIFEESGDDSWSDSRNSIEYYIF